MAARPRLSKRINVDLFSAEYKHQLLNRFELKYDLIDACKVWSGAKNSCGYPQTKVKDPLIGKITVSVHRLIFSFLSGNDLGLPGCQVSHLCHNKACINYEHLNFEPAATNSQRNICLQSRTCVGHGDQPRCILPAHN